MGSVKTPEAHHLAGVEAALLTSTCSEQLQMIASISRGPAHSLPLALAAEAGPTATNKVAQYPWARQPSDPRPMPHAWALCSIRQSKPTTSLDFACRAAIRALEQRSKHVALPWWSLPSGCSQDGTLFTLSEMMRSTNVLTRENP